MLPSTFSVLEATLTFTRRIGQKSSGGQTDGPTPKRKGILCEHILVWNLSPNATEQDIRPLFEQHGIAERFKIMTDFKRDQPRGFAFVQMRSDAEAERATAAAPTERQTNRVSAAHPQLHRKPSKKSKQGEFTSLQERLSR
jgi:hypothetical protein